MSINARALSVLRNVQEILVGQFADLDLVSLSYLGGHHDFSRVALMLEAVAPLLAKFGRATDEGAGYVGRQSNNARLFKRIVNGIGTMIVIVCILIIYSYGRQPGTWFTRAVFFGGIITVCIIVLALLHVMRVMVRDRTDRILSLNNNELARYKRELSDNPFVGFINARLLGPEKVREYQKEIAVDIQRTVDDVGGYENICPSQNKPAAGTLPPDMCIIISPCQQGEAISKSLPDILRGHFNGSSPCGKLLRLLFLALQDVKDGSKVTQLDRHQLWTRISVGAETLRGFLLWRILPNESSAITEPENIKAAVDAEIIGTLRLQLLEVANLRISPGGGSDSKPFKKDSRGACWAECFNKGAECRWASYNDGDCTVGTTDVVPGSVASLFQYVRDTTAPDSADAKPLLLHVPRAAAAAKTTAAKTSATADKTSATAAKTSASTTSPDYYICGQEVTKESQGSLTPMIYSGQITLAQCASDTSCGVAVVADRGVLASGNSLGAVKVTGYDAPSDLQYQTALTPINDTDTSKKEGYCQKVSAEAMWQQNPQRLVHTYMELEPQLRSKLMHIMEKYKYRIDLVAYRSKILNALRVYYGTTAFTELSPYVLDTLGAVEKAIVAAKAAIKNTGWKYVTVQRLQSRIEALTTAERGRLSEVIGDMARSVYMYQRHFKPWDSNFGIWAAHVGLTYGIVVAIVLVLLFFLAQLKCLTDGGCSVFTVIRNLALCGCLTAVIIVLLLSAYRKSTTRTMYNRDVSDRNGQFLVQKTAELSAAYSGTSEFTLEVAVVSKNGAVYVLQNVSQTPATTGLRLTPNSTLAGLKLAGVTGRPGGFEAKSVYVTFRGANGTAQTILLRSLQLVDVQGTLQQTFRFDSAVVLDKDRSLRVPLRQSTTFNKAVTSDTFELTAFLADNVADYNVLYTTMKQVVETYDKCNSLARSQKDMPFPTLDLVVMVVGAALVLFALMYIMAALKPLEKVRNIRNLMNVRKRLRVGDAVPEFDSLITCCKTPGSVWERIMDVGVVVLLMFTIYASVTVSSSTADFRAALYSSAEYTDSKCI